MAYGELLISGLVPNGPGWLTGGGAKLDPKGGQEGMRSRSGLQGIRRILGPGREGQTSMACFLGTCRMRQSCMGGWRPA